MDGADEFPAQSQRLRVGERLLVFIADQPASGPAGQRDGSALPLPDAACVARVDGASVTCGGEKFG